MGSGRKTLTRSWRFDSLLHFVLVFGQKIAEKWFCRRGLPRERYTLFRHHRRFCQLKSERTGKDLPWVIFWHGIILELNRIFSLSWSNICVFLVRCFNGGGGRGGGRGGKCWLRQIFIKALDESPSYFIQSKMSTSAHEYSESDRANLFAMLLQLNFWNGHRGRAGEVYSQGVRCSHQLLHDHQTCQPLDNLLGSKEGLASRS